MIHRRNTNLPRAAGPRTDEGREGQSMELEKDMRTAMTSSLGLVEERKVIRWQYDSGRKEGFGKENTAGEAEWTQAAGPRTGCTKGRGLCLEGSSASSIGGLILRQSVQDTTGGYIQFCRGFG